MSNSKYILVGKTPVEELDLFTWGRWMETADRCIAHTMQGPVSVSTVFLGLDHDLGGEGPKLFETMVFRHGASEDCDRYSTWDQAQEGHANMVRKALSRRYEPIKG